MSYFERIKMELADSSSVDAFGRLRVSNPETLFDSQNQYDVGRVFWQDVVAGVATATHRADESSVRLSVTASAADSLIRQTRDYIRYQPGKSQFIAMTFVLGAATAGLDRRAGYFDDDDGVFVEQNGTTALNLALRSSTSGSPVNDKIAQASWNLDTLDGTGKSGITLDTSKSQILIIDLQWLSVGRVRIGFQFAGAITYAHEFLNANTLTAAYMKTANLPLRYELDTDGTNAGSMDCICAHVSSEGGFERGHGSNFAADRGTSGISVSATLVPIISIRPKATFNSVVTRGLIVPLEHSAYASAVGVLIRAIYGATLTGASFSSANADSITEFDIAATAISGGIQVAGDYIQRQSHFSADLQHRYPLALDKAGAHPTSPYTDSFTIAALKVSGGSADTFASVEWTEHR